MIGYGKNEGIVPQSCKEIFRRIREEPAPDTQYEVTVSMIEIYNEKVFDLLSGKRSKNGLDLKLFSDSGFQVVGLLKKPCENYAEITGAMETGNKNRSIGATKMN